MNKKYFCHSSSLVNTNNIGEGTTVWAFVNILKGAIIGKNVNICDHCFIEDKVVIGDNVTIKCGVYLWNGIIIENDVFIGANVGFTNDKLPRSKNTNYINENTVLKKGCSIGTNSVLLPNISIGKYAMVGAGSVVTKTVADFSIVMGNPAQPYGYICICGKKLDTKTLFCECGNEYKLVKNNLFLVDEKK